MLHMHTIWRMDVNHFCSQGGHLFLPGSVCHFQGDPGRAIESHSLLVKVVPDCWCRSGWPQFAFFSLLTANNESHFYVQSVTLWRSGTSLCSRLRVFWVGASLFHR